MPAPPDHPDGPSGEEHPSNIGWRDDLRPTAAGCLLQLEGAGPGTDGVRDSCTFTVKVCNRAMECRDPGDGHHPSTWPGTLPGTLFPVAMSSLVSMNTAPRLHGKLRPAVGRRLPEGYRPSPTRTRTTSPSCLRLRAGTRHQRSRAVPSVPSRVIS